MTNLMIVPDCIKLYGKGARFGAKVGMSLALAGLGLAAFTWHLMTSVWLGGLGIALLVIALVMETAVLFMGPATRDPAHVGRPWLFETRVRTMAEHGGPVIVWYDLRPTIMFLGLGFPLLIGLVLIGFAGGLL